MRTYSDAPIAYMAGGESRIVEFRGGVVAKKWDGRGIDQLRGEMKEGVRT